MKEDGEYLDIKPSHEQCYNFFRELNPIKWKTETKKTELKSLKPQLLEIFDKKKQNFVQNLFESNLFYQFTESDEKRGAQIQLINKRFVEKNVLSEEKPHKQIIKDLNDVFCQEKIIRNCFKKELKKKLTKELYRL